MSNTVTWRKKVRTKKPNASQKRNGLFLDERPVCEDCRLGPAVHAHHDLPHGHPSRFDHQCMRALCEPCHVEHHRSIANLQKVQKPFVCFQPPAKAAKVAERRV